MTMMPGMPPSTSSCRRALAYIVASVGGGVVLIALVWAQTIEVQFPGVGQVWTLPGPTCSGWPLIHWTKWNWSLNGPPQSAKGTWSYEPIAINAAILLTLVSGTFGAVFYMARRICWPLQFKLSSLIVMTAVVALTIASWQRFPQWIVLLSKPRLTYYEYLGISWNHDPWWLTAAWTFALACTIYLLLLAALRAIGFIVHLVRR
jgi:hypothetical protein